jgi:hypothetical protein
LRLVVFSSGARVCDCSNKSKINSPKRTSSLYGLRPIAPDHFPILKNASQPQVTPINRETPQKDAAHSDMEKIGMRFLVHRMKYCYGPKIKSPAFPASKNINFISTKSLNNAPFVSVPIIFQTETQKDYKTHLFICRMPIFPSLT